MSEVFNFPFPHLIIALLCLVIARYVVVLSDEREFKFKPENLTLGIRTRSGTDVRKLRFVPNDPLFEPARINYIPRQSAHEKFCSRGLVYVTTGHTLPALSERLGPFKLRT